MLLAACCWLQSCTSAGVVALSSHACSPQDEPRSTFSVCRHITAQAATDGSAQQQQQPASAAAIDGSMKICVHAVGAAVYLVDAHSTADKPGLQELPSRTLAAAASGTSISTPSVEGAAAAAGANVSDWSAAAEPGLEELTRSAAGADEAQASTGLLRMLALYLDLGLDMDIEVRQ